MWVQVFLDTISMQWIRYGFNLQDEKGAGVEERMKKEKWKAKKFIAFTGH